MPFACSHRKPLLPYSNDNQTPFEFIICTQSARNEYGRWPNQKLTANKNWLTQMYVCPVARGFDPPLSIHKERRALPAPSVLMETQLLLSVPDFSFRKPILFLRSSKTIEWKRQRYSTVFVNQISLRKHLFLCIILSLFALRWPNVSWIHRLMLVLQTPL